MVARVGACEAEVGFTCATVRLAHAPALRCRKSSLEGVRPGPDWWSVASGLLCGQIGDEVGYLRLRQCGYIAGYEARKVGGGAAGGRTCPHAVSGLGARVPVRVPEEVTGEPGHAEYGGQRKARIQM